MHGLIGRDRGLLLAHLLRQIADALIEPDAGAARGIAFGCDLVGDIGGHHRVGDTRRLGGIARRGRHGDGGGKAVGANADMLLKIIQDAIVRALAVGIGVDAIKPSPGIERRAQIRHHASNAGRRQQRIEFRIVLEPQLGDDLTARSREVRI